MPSRRVTEPSPESERCKDPDHAPPQHRVYGPGLWDHRCPTCGAATKWEVPVAQISNAKAEHADAEAKIERDGDDDVAPDMVEDVVTLDLKLPENWSTPDGAPSDFGHE